VKQQGVGESLSSFSQLIPALERMLVPETLEKLRGRVAAIENRAIFEIPEILATLLLSPHTMQK